MDGRETGGSSADPGRYQRERAEYEHRTSQMRSEDPMSTAGAAVGVALVLFVVVGLLYLVAKYYIF